MKTLHLSIIVGVGIIAIITGVLMVELDQKKSIVPMETNQSNVHPSVSNIIIPAGAEDPSSGKNYEPRYLVVVLGINNTVKWANESPSDAHAIVADNHDDPLFWNATRSANSVLLLPGKSFNFTFTKAGEFQYDTDPHPWMYGWVLVLPQSAKNATTTVSLNTSSGIPGPCEVFGIPCPNNPSNPNSYNFTAQKFGQDIYIEEMTINGVDTYAILKPNKDCYYPQGYGNTCINPDDLAILRLVGVNTSIPQEYVDITISGLQQQYTVGEPIIFGLKINGYGYDACEIPSVSVFGNNGSIVWQSLKTPWISCIPGRGQHNTVIEMNALGGPFSINQTGTYTVHVDYASNSTEAKFDIIQATSIQQTNTIFGDFYQGIENDSGIVSIKNQTYYMMTASNTTYPVASGMTVKFHNVTFSFPYGAQATPGGIIIPFDMTFPDGTTETYGNVTKNPDGSGSISGISLGPGPSSNSTVTVQSGHMHPQAGVTLTENQIKLLVSTESQNDTVNIGNKTFYFTTLNDTLSSYHGVAAIPFTFHGIDFTLFPSAFSPGPPSNSTLSCGNTNFSSEVKFTDETYEKLDAQIPGPPCSENYTEIVLSNHQNPRAGVQVYQGKIRLLASTRQTSENSTLSASFIPCDMPFSQNSTGIAALYMPVNSNGKLCVRYHNLNDVPEPIGIRIFEAGNMSQDVTDVTTWNDSGNNTIPKGNSTVVYWVKTGNHKGFYGLELFCVGMPFAVGYDNSTLVQSNFPWLGQNTFFCPAEFYDFHIDSTTGFGVKYFPWK